MRRLLLCLFALLFTTPVFAAVPAGYTELEYIESTGTQYIVLPTFPNASNIDITTSVQHTTGTGEQILFGESGIQFLYTVNTAWRFWASGGAGAFGDLTLLIADKHLFEIKTTSSGVEYYVDGVKDTDVPESFINSSNFVGKQFNFGVRTNSTPDYFWSGKIYSFKATCDGRTCIDLVPAKRNSDSAIGMYDSVSGTFFTNAGTGTFIAGPDGPCANLFDASTVTYGKLLNFDGSFSNDDPGRFGYSDYFSVQANQTYVISPANLFTSVNGMAWYDENKQYISGVVFNKSVLRVTAPANAVYARTSYSNNWGDAFSIKLAACTEIQVATTKHVSAAFSGVNSQLAAAITTVNSVVTATIEQASRIATLATGKQTRPADGTECPQYRQCLLVEDESGVPHWYEINDPFYNFFQPILATGTNGASSTNDPGYQQLEYIQGVSGATGPWIDTGVYLTSEHTVEFVIWGGGDVFGVRNPNEGTYPGASYGATGGMSVDLYKSTSEISSARLTVNISNVNSAVLVHLENGRRLIKNLSTGEILGSNDYITGYFENTYTAPFFVLAWGKPAADWSNRYGGRVYSLKIWDGDGVLIRDMVPVIQNTTGKVGMYDRVNNVFYGNVSGNNVDFVPGPIVENEAGVPAATWTATWAANANGVMAGTVYGEGLCNAVSGTFATAATSAQLSSSDWNTVGSSCWCKVSGLTVGGEYSAAPSTTSWVFKSTYGSAAVCARDCASHCAYDVREYGTFRSAMFGSVK